MKISDKTIYETIQATDIVELIAADIDYMGTANGEVWEGACPFCPSEEATFHVHKERQVFNCTACAVNGNAGTYVQLRDKCTMVEAVKTLSLLALKRLGIEQGNRRIPCRATLGSKA